jgi:hypothetical protein
MTKINIYQFFRYGYGGFLIFLIAYLVDEKTLGFFLKNSFLSSITLFLLGGVFYASHRAFIGDWLYGIFECIHSKWFAKCEGHETVDNKGRYHTCKMLYFREELGVRKKNLWDVYRIVRDQKMNDEFRNYLYNRASEVHLLYLTSFSFFISTILLLIIPLCSCAHLINPCKLLFSVFLFFLFTFLAFLAEIQLCRAETSYIKTMDKNHLKNLIKKADFYDTG